MMAFLKTIEIVISVIVVLLSYVLPLNIFDYNLTNFSSFDFLASFIAVVSLIVFLSGEYTDGDKVSKSKNILKIFLSTAAIAFIITALAFFLRGFSFPRSLVIIGFLIQNISLSIIRIGFRSLSRKSIYNHILTVGIECERQWLFNKAQNAKLPRELIKGYWNRNIIRH